MPLPTVTKSISFEGRPRKKSRTHPPHGVAGAVDGIGRLAYSVEEGGVKPLNYGF